VNAFSGRGGEHMDDLDPLSGPEVADAPIAAFRDWEHVSGERFADLTKDPPAQACRQRRFFANHHHRSAT